MSLNINRVLNLIRRDITYYKRVMAPIILGFLLFNVVMFLLVNYINSNGNIQPYFWTNWFGLFIFIMGLIFTLNVFPEYKSSDDTIKYHSLPASNLEKYSTRWLYAILLFPMLITLTFALFSWMTPGVVKFSTLRNNGFGLGQLLITFTVFNSVALLLAVKRNRFKSIKDFFVVLGLLILSIIVLAIFAKLIFFQYFDGWSINSMTVNFTENFEEVIAPKFGRAILFIGKYLLPVLFWVVGYFKFIENEA